MKKIKSLIYIAIVGLTTTFVSCKDWLSLMPLNEVVLENFWTEKADVESVLLGAYATLETNDQVTRMSIWGEMRSDNIISNTSAPNDIIQITKDNILETNSYMSWSGFYECINRANTVLHFAPIVAEKDPNYTPAELNAHIAEATAIRALAYWYLIRAYKDVPFVTEPSIDDTQDFVVPAEKFEVILQQLIEDLEAVKRNAVNKYVLEEANTSRFTRSGIEALLADLYLWNGEWDKCIETVNSILERKMEEYKDLKENKGYTTYVDVDDIELFFDRFPLISNIDGQNWGKAYNQIFGTGYSFETLFELSYMPADGSTDLRFIREFYCNRTQSSTNIGNLKAEPRTGAGFSQGTNVVFESKYDGRYVQSVQETSSDYAIVKYAASNVSYKLNTGEVKDLSYSWRGEKPSMTWIVYRLTDVMLMKAEALTMKAKEMGSELAGDTLVARDALIEQAFVLVQAVNKRAKGYDVYGASVDTIPYAAYKGNPLQMEELVLKERRREFLFEGKRWFDLVRMARRDGDTERLSQMVLLKYTENVSAVRIKLADMDAIYFPIAKDERKINPLLKQNPAYEEEEFIQKAE